MNGIEPRLLLTVEDTFTIRKRGVVLVPDVPPREARPTTFAVTLRRPDGSTRAAVAVAQIAMGVGFTEPRAHVRLLDVSKDDVPVGTEVWVE